MVCRLHISDCDTLLSLECIQSRAAVSAAAKAVEEAKSAADQIHKILDTPNTDE